MCLHNSIHHIRYSSEMPANPGKLTTTRLFFSMMYNAGIRGCNPFRMQQISSLWQLLFERLVCMFEWEEIKRDSILSQLKFLEAARQHHLIWADHTKDAELEKMHLQIAASLKQAILDYQSLFDRYPNFREGS